MKLFYQGYGKLGRIIYSMWHFENNAWSFHEQIMILRKYLRQNNVSNAKEQKDLQGTQKGSRDDDVKYIYI